MPTTARIHFDDDIARADLLRIEASRVQTDGLARDIRISGVALAVGALDAYLCDAYVDCLATVLRAYFLGEWKGRLPRYYAKQQLPAGEILDNSRKMRPLWSIRMAARKVMERDDMLSIGRLPDYFNPILPAGQKLWVDFLPRIQGHGYARLSGPRSAAEIAAMAGKAKESATKASIEAIKSRLSAIIQIRHDWIHNCGRPKAAIQPLTDGEARVRIRDIRIFVTELDDHLEAHRRA